VSAVHLGVQLATSGITWRDLRDAATRVESLGYDSLWVPDHLVAWEGAVPRLEAWQVLAGLAAVTSRIRIGPLVSPVTFRHPAVLAKMAAALDPISGGRVILGLGAGGMAEEHRRFGLPLGTASERRERFEEAVTIVRSLLDEPVSSFEGKHYRLRDARAEPKPVQPHLPLLIGGTGVGALRVAANLGDWWNGIALAPSLAEKVGMLRAYLAEAGRRPDEVVATASFRLIIRSSEAAVARRLEELDPGWRDDAYRISGDAPSVKEQLQAFVRAGADGLIVQCPAPFDLETLERLADDVGPHLERER